MGIALSCGCLGNQGVLIRSGLFGSHHQQLRKYKCKNKHWYMCTMCLQYCKRECHSLKVPVFILYHVLPVSIGTIPCYTHIPFCLFLRSNTAYSLRFNSTIWRLDSSLVLISKSQNNAAFEYKRQSTFTSFNGGCGDPSVKHSFWVACHHFHRSVFHLCCNQ